MEKKFGIHMQDRSVAARSQGFKLYKAEDLPSNSNLNQMTAPAAKLVLLQRITLDKDLDLDSQHEIQHSQRRRGLIKGSQHCPAKDQPALDDPEIQHIQHDWRSRHKWACKCIDCNDCMSILSQRRK